MDRLRLWIESSKQHSSNNEATDGPYITTVKTTNAVAPGSNSFFKQQRRIQVPPPLRTSNTYDDDEAFTNVSLNLLSRQNGLGLSPIETVMATLISPKQRSSYYDGLTSRLDRLIQLSPSLISIVQSIESIFGTDLRSIVEKECCITNATTIVNNVAETSTALSNTSTGNNGGGTAIIPLFQRLPPIAPRHVSSSVTTTSSSIGTVVSDLSIATSTSSISRCSKASNTSCDTKIMKQQRKKRRRFFPDTNSTTSCRSHTNKCTANNNIISTSSSLSSSSSFFRNKTRVQNIDWKLVQAIQQVETLRLDGPTNSDDDVHTATSSSSNSSPCSNRCVNNNEKVRNNTTIGYQPPAYHSYQSHR